jgi:DNA repair protein RecO (recombination protein O)
MLRELGYGDLHLASMAEPADPLGQFDALGLALERYLLADRRLDVMGARAMLRGRLARIG